MRRTGRSIRLVRTSLEVSVLVVGWLLGGTVGVGTLLYAVSIGPLVQAFLPHLVVELPVGAAGRDGAERVGAGRVSAARPARPRRRRSPSRPPL
ncbi:hypothetical protein BH20ACT6_BH20ACT6_13510 [soil metagenome]